MDAIEEKDGVEGGGEPAKGGIDEELDGKEEGWYHEKGTFGDWKKRVLARSGRRSGDLPS